MQFIVKFMNLNNNQVFMKYWWFENIHVTQIFDTYYLNEYILLYLFFCIIYYI